jgi:hypothetical protein
MTVPAINQKILFLNGKRRIKELSFSARRMVAALQQGSMV